MLALLSTVWLAFANPEATPETAAPEAPIQAPAAEPAPAGPPYRLIEPPLAEAEPIAVLPIPEGPSPAAPSPEGEPALTEVEPALTAPEPDALPAYTAPVQPPPKPAERKRLSKAQRLLVGGGVAFGLGTSIQWATAAGTGILGDARPGATSGITLGMTVGSIGIIEGTLLGAIAGGALGKEQGRDQDPRRSRALRAGGGVILGLGGAAIVGTALFWPSLRDACPIGVGCALTGLHLGGAALGVGGGMLGYGNAVRPYDPDRRSLSKKSKTPLIAGATLLTIGYFNSAILGMYTWQGDPGDPVARRMRNRMLIPVVGPWIHAAGPDADLPMAIITGGMGALQIAGVIALAVGTGLSVRERRRGEVALVPSFNGVAVVGRF